MSQRPTSERYEMDSKKGRFWVVILLVTHFVLLTGFWPSTRVGEYRLEEEVVVLHQELVHVHYQLEHVFQGLLMLKRSLFVRQGDGSKFQRQQNLKR